VRQRKDHVQSHVWFYSEEVIRRNARRKRNVQQSVIRKIIQTLFEQTISDSFGAKKKKRSGKRGIEESKDDSTPLSTTKISFVRRQSLKLSCASFSWTVLYANLARLLHYATRTSMANCKWWHCERQSLRPARTREPVRANLHIICESELESFDDERWSTLRWSSLASRCRKRKS